MTSAGASESPRQGEEVFAEKGGTHTICSAPNHHEPVHHNQAYDIHTHHLFIYLIPVLLHVLVHGTMYMYNTCTCTCIKVGVLHPNLDLVDVHVSLLEY